MADESSVKWNRSDDISVPVSDSERRYAIRKADWERLKRNLSECTDESSSLPVWYSILFGVSGSAGLSIFPIAITKDLSPWVTPLYVIIFIAAGVLAFALVGVEKW